MSNKLYKVKIFGDNRLTITLHNFNPFHYAKRLPSTRTDIITAKPTNKFMSVKDYKRLIKTAHKKLWDMDFEQDRCYFVTLTLNKDLDYQRLNNEFHRFWIYIKRKFGGFEYIRAIERQEVTLRLHIHTIIQFNDKPTIFNQSIVENLWGLGKCNVQPVYDIRGSLQYITKFKEQNIQKNNPDLTCFLRGARVISMSQHFGVKIDSTAYREETITAEHLEFILKYHFKEYFENDGKFVRVDGHYFYNLKKYESDYCMDRIYIRSTQEFVESNFGELNQNIIKGETPDL